MRYKKRIITVKNSNPKENPNLHKSMPFSYRIKGRGELSQGQIYEGWEVIMNISEYLVHNPEFIILRPKRLPKKEKVLRETLDKMVEEHNLALERRRNDLVFELGIGKRYRRKSRVKKIFRLAGE